MSCSIYPQIKDKNGILYNSILFKGLTQLTSRENTGLIYKIIKYDKSGEFESLTQDKLGEPVLGSLIKFYDLSSQGITVKSLETKEKELNNKEGLLKAKFEDSWSKFRSKYKDRMDKFNNDHPLNSVFSFTYEEKEGKFKPKIELNKSVLNRELTEGEKAIKYNKDLNLALTKLLTEWGISIGELNEIDELLGVKGITDFNLANTKANGFIELIRLANGEIGQSVLPEEFAHVALRLAKNSPLVQRLLALANNESIIKEYLGEEYDNYNELYNGDKDLLAEETAGKILAKALTGELTPSTPKSFIRRVWDNILSFFRGKDHNDILKLKDEIATTYYEARGKIMAGHLNNWIIKRDNINTKQRLANLQKNAIDKQKLIENLIYNIEKKLSVYANRKKNNSNYITSQKALIAEMEKLHAAKMYEKALLKYLEKSLSELQSIDTRFEDMEKPLALNHKARIIRDLSNFLAFYQSTMGDILLWTIQEPTISDDTKGLVSGISSLISSLEVKKNQWSVPIVVSFLSEFYDLNKMKNPFNPDGKIMDLETLIKEATRDISTLELWLDSVAQGTDMVLKMVDQANKDAKHRARISTIDVKNKIYEALYKLEKAGHKDQSFMFARDDKGNKTGNYIGRFTKEYALLTDAQKEFYNTILKIKNELESALPEKYRDELRTIKIRKELYERVVGGETITESVLDNLKNSVLRRSDDNEFGGISTLTDFEGKQVMNLPIYYVSTREEESEDDMTEDVASSMIAYASMALEFKEMNKIIHALELTRDVLRDREVTVTRNSKSLVSVFNKKETEVTIKQSIGTNLQSRIDYYFLMQIYGAYTKDEGNLWNTKIDKAKLGNALMRITAVNSLSMNLLSAISNVSQGVLMNEIELAVANNYSRRDLVKADEEYAKLILPHLANAGERVKTDFLSLWNDLFDTLQDYESRDRNQELNRRNLFTKVFGSDLLFIFQNAPEHWLQTRTSLALGFAYKMRDNNGNIVSLIDSLEIKYNDPNNPKAGARLVVKEGYRKEDGSIFKEEDVIAFTKKNAAINQRLNGIYNKLDRNALQYHVLGRMAFMFRKWMPAYWNRRYQRTTYNFDLDQWTEGYYVTTGKFVEKLYNNLKEGKLNVILEWDNLTNEQRANLKAAIKEISIFLLLLGLVSLIDWDGEEKDRSYWSYLLEHQMRRTYMEVGAFMPGPSMLTEGLKLLKSPSATIAPIESTIDLLGIFNPNNYEFIAGKEALIKSGRFKGESKAERLWWKSPFIPMSNTIYKVFNPQETIDYYK